MIKAEDSELASLNLIKVSKIDIAGPTHSTTVKSLEHGLKKLFNSSYINCEIVIFSTFTLSWNRVGSVHVSFHNLLFLLEVISSLPPAAILIGKLSLCCLYKKDKIHLEMTPN